MTQPFPGYWDWFWTDVYWRLTFTAIFIFPASLLYAGWLYLSAREDTTERKERITRLFHS